jgi:hypothetical protein
MAVSYKCTEVAKTTVPFEAKDALAAKAHLAGCDAAEYLRDLIYMDLHGCTFGEHVANHRRAVIGKQGPALAQLRAAA